MSEHEKQLIEMRKLVLQAEEYILKAKEIANKYGYTFTVANTTYDGSREDWIVSKRDSEYWDASGVGC